MRDSGIWPVALVLAVLTGGCGKGPDTTGPARKATPASAKVITNSIGMKLVEIPAGEFMMGSPDSDSYGLSDERPQHRVRITKPFYLGTTEVTQEQYKKVMGWNPSHFRSGTDAPVEKVSWANAQEFCQKLSELTEEKKAGRRYQLPTEAQWEYACRAGSAEQYCFGDDLSPFGARKSRLGDYAWYWGNSDDKTHQVGQKKPNAWGLYDMHGNVWEWCVDWYDRKYYANSPTDDPTGPSAGSDRVSRGGSWRHATGAYCRSACRNSGWPAFKLSNLGFRVSLVRAG